MYVYIYVSYIINNHPKGTATYLRLRSNCGRSHSSSELDQARIPGSTVAMRQRRQNVKRGDVYRMGPSNVGGW